MAGTAGVLTYHDVAAPKELAVDVNLGERRPLRVLLRARYPALGWTLGNSGQLCNGGNTDLHAAPQALVFQYIYSLVRHV